MVELVGKIKIEKNPLVKDKLLSIEEFYRKTPDSMGYVNTGRHTSVRHSSN